MATACGSCHVGGSLVEKGLDGIRHSLRSFELGLNPYNNYVDEKFDPVTGLPAFSVAQAPWAMPGTFDNQMPSGGNEVVPGNFVPQPAGFRLEAR